MTIEMTQSSELLRLFKVAIEYRISRRGAWGRKQTMRALDEVTLAVRAGESLGVVGESGCGKTTLGRTIVRLLEPSSGRLLFDGVDITHMPEWKLRPLRPKMQMIFQDPAAALDPRMRIESSLSEPLRHSRTLKAQQVRERVAELLELVGLNPDLSVRHPHEFSGGQLQRVGIARALASDPRLLVCDEPVSGLDVSVQGQILNLLKALRTNLGLTYVFIGHNLAVIRLICDRVAVMYLGKLVELGSVADVYAAPSHPYTRALLSVVPSSRKVRFAMTESAIRLRGDVPSPIAPPRGCRFHTRCWLYESLGRPEQCRTVEPAMAAVHENHTSSCHFAPEVATAIPPVVDSPDPAATRATPDFNERGGGKDRRCIPPTHIDSI